MPTTSNYTKIACIKKAVHLFSISGSYHTFWNFTCPWHSFFFYQCKYDSTELSRLLLCSHLEERSVIKLCAYHKKWIMQIDEDFLSTFMCCFLSEIHVTWKRLMIRQVFFFSAHEIKFLKYLYSGNPDVHSLTL